MNSYKLTLAYDGAPFCGFARQPNTLTVQGELERALKIVIKEDVETVCAGRTDTGVHAREQVVSFSCNADALNIKKSLNALIGENIAILKIEEVDESFSARFDAKWREYRYFVYNKPHPPIFTSRYTWHIKKPLDSGRMADACHLLKGEHDFKSFCLAASAEGKNTRREIFDIEIFEQDSFDGELLCLRVVGNAFLHSMIRAITGTLVDVGKGKRNPEDINDVLLAKDRRAAGENAPAKGLVFWHVEY